MAPPRPTSSSSASNGPPPQRRHGVLCDASNTPGPSNTHAWAGTPRQDASPVLKRARVEEADGTVDPWGRKRVFGKRDWQSREQHDLEKKRARFIAAIKSKKAEEVAFQRAGQGRGNEAVKIRQERECLEKELKAIESQISRLDGGSETSASDGEDEPPRWAEHRALGVDVFRRWNRRLGSRNCSQQHPSLRPPFELRQRHSHGSPGHHHAAGAGSDGSVIRSADESPAPRHSSSSAHSDCEPRSQRADCTACWCTGERSISVAHLHESGEPRSRRKRVWISLQSLVDEIARNAYTLPLKKTLKLDGLVINGRIKAGDKPRILKLILHLLEEVSRGEQAKEALSSLGLKPANEIKTVKHIFFAVQQD
ncbi:hypothetical protein JCM10049v2_003703 [Rhodotorula toruloides]